MKLIDIDKKIPALNNLSLREVFEGGNLVVNGDFDISSTPNPIFIQTGLTILLNDRIYISYDQLDSMTSNIRNTPYLSNTGNTTLQGVSFTENFRLTAGFYSDIIIANSNKVNLVHWGHTLNPFPIRYRNYKLYNLTSLGLTALTKEQLDHYFALYQSGVEASGFVQKTSKNLLTDWEQGNISTISGADVVASDRIRTGFLSALPNTTYTIRSQITSAYAVVAYNENKNYVTIYASGSHAANTANTFTTGSTIRYLRLAIRKEPITTITPSDYVDFNVQLELGTVATAYQPYRPFALAKGIDEVAYGGKTYREIFEGGQFLTFTQGQAFQLSNVSFNENNVSFTNNTNTISFVGITPVLPTTTNEWYITFRTSGVIGQGYGHAFGNGPRISFFLQSQNQLHSYRRTIVGRGNRLYFELYVTDTSGLNNTHSYKDIHAINLTQLFGSGNEPDKATMDKLFQQYQEGGTVQAQAFIQTAGKDTRVIDAKLPYLNMMSIREVFESNLVVNGDFSDGGNNWVLNQSTIVDNQLAFSNPLAYVTFQTTPTVLSAQTYYTRFIARKTTTDIPRNYVALFLNSSSATTSLFEHIISSDTFTTYSSIQTTSTTANRIQIGRYNTIGSLLLDDLYMVNLTALNLTHLTQAELDAMFALYQAGTLKLSDVFETGNLVTNHDFSDGTTGWSTTFSLNSVVGNNLINTADGTGSTPRATTSTYGTTDAFYTLARLRVTNSLSNDLSIRHNVTSIANQANPIANQWYVLSGIHTNTTSTTLRLYHTYVDNATANGKVMEVDYAYVTNLNTHNLQATTKTFMDDLFKAYNRYKSPLFIDKDGTAYAHVFVSKGD